VPTYAYACTTCDHRFEVQQSFSDASLTQCPECEGKLRKLFSTVGIVFKGSGFYRTDSRTPAASGSSSKDGASKDGASKDGASKDGASKVGASKDGASKDGAPKPAETSSSSSGSSSSSSASGGSGGSKSAAPAA
jgi:putative FmdB family regulatory protein